ncbi:hypothetical protein BH23ACT5_BH23ACT5_17040 [soil metagenome]
MGHKRCRGDHAFEVSSLGAGMRRMECAHCGALVIDLDAREGQPPVSAPGLFKRSGPTIFSVLGEEARHERARLEFKDDGEPSGPRYAFEGRPRRRLS